MTTPSIPKVSTIMKKQGMEKHSRKNRLIRTGRVGLAAATAVLVAGCGGSTGNVAAEGGDGPSLALVTSDPLGTNQFLAGIDEGFETAAANLDADKVIYESKGDPQTMQANLDAAVRAKPDLIVVTGFTFLDIMTTAAPTYPDQEFLIVDSCIPNPPSNVTCAQFREWEAAYLAGIEAGMLTKADNVGNIGATDTPVAHRYDGPFQEGLNSIKPDASYKRVVVGGQNPYNDPARAKELALSLNAGGADYVMSAAAAGNYGVFEAAESGQFGVFGVDTNQCLDAPGVVVDNVIKNLAQATEQGIDDALNGSGGIQSYGLAEEGVSVVALWDDKDLAASKCLVADHPEIVAAVREAAQGIIDGSITVADPAAVEQ